MTAIPPTTSLWRGDSSRLVIGIFATVFLVAFEAMAVAAAMPIAAAELDGLGLYAWSFTGFLVASLVAMVAAGEVSGSAAKQVLGELVESGGDPAEVVAARGLGRAGGDELSELVERAMADQADAVEKVRAGNDKAIGAIMGLVMRETKGRADGGEVQRLIRDRL